MSFVPRLRIGRKLGASSLVLVGTLDEIRLSVGAGRNLALTQTAPWPNPLDADPDVADTGWVDVVAHRDGFDDQPKRFTVTRTRRGISGTSGTNGTNGTNGIRGTVSLSRQVSGTTWLNSEAVAAILAAGYGVPQPRDTVTLYNPSAAFSETRFYDGAAWLPLTHYLSGNLFVDGTIAGSKLIAGTVTADFLNAATGTFGGTLLAGVLSLEKLVGTSANYAQGSYTLTVPTDFTTMRVTLTGAGGGGGVGVGSERYGGGGGGVSIATFSGLTAGHTYTLTVGAGGTAGLRAGTRDGGSGGSTEVNTLAAPGQPIAFSAGGGGGGTAAGGAGGPGTSANGQAAQQLSQSTYYPNETGDLTGQTGTTVVVHAYPGGNSGLAMGLGGACGVGIVGSPGGLYGGGGGASSATTGQDDCTDAGAGGAGRATIEFFNPNSVVIRSEWNTLLAALQAQSISTS